MTAIITEKFRRHNAIQFYESVTEAEPTAYYLMIGKSTPFTAGTSSGTDTSPPTPIDDVASEFYAWDQATALKNISSADVTYALPRRDWVNNTIYDMYEHNISSTNTTTSSATNLYDSTFFFRTSSNRVYKVLDNNGGAAYSGTEPTSVSASPFSLGGYVLRYIYTITASEHTKFLITNFMPVSTDTTISAAATDGKIESLVTTPGSQYTEGRYYAAVYGDGVSAGTSSGAVVSIVVSSGGTITSFGLSAGTDTTVNSGGSGYTYGTVNLGSSYTYSSATLSTLSSMGSGSAGVVSVVISPKNGHGYDAVGELGGHYVMLRTTLTGAEGDDVLAGNDFRNISVVIDPTTYDTSTVASLTTYRQTYATKLTSASGTFSVDEKITQASTSAIGKVVEWDSDLSILYYHQERYSNYGTSTAGAYVAFSGANQITGEISSAGGTPDASADGAVTLTGGNTITFTDGYANPELQPDSGNIIYQENRKPISRATDQTEDIKIIVEF